MLAEILGQLDSIADAAQDTASLTKALPKLMDLTHNLDTFEIEFGMQPRATPGWDRIEVRARQLLPLFDALSKDADNFTSVETATCVLLELSGKSNQALDRLSAMQDSTSFGTGTGSFKRAFNQRKTGVLQRTGKYFRALATQKEVMGQGSDMLDDVRPDLTISRYAFLLEKNGETDESARYYQLVVDLFPGTSGAALARRALVNSGALVEPTAARIDSIYLADDAANAGAQTGSIKRAQYQKQALFALARHRFPESFEILSSRLVTGSNSKRYRVLPALAELGDPRAVAIIGRLMEKENDIALSIHGAAALHQLGNDVGVQILLQRLGQSESPEFLDWTDRVLRGVYKGGPADKSAWEGNPAAFSRTWASWIKQQTVTTVAAP